MAGYTVSAALARCAVAEGKRVLVCEVDAKGNLADFYEAGATAFAAREIQPNEPAMTGIISTYTPSFDAMSSTRSISMPMILPDGSR